MNISEKASLQVLKITIVLIILIFTSNIAVRAFNSKLNNVKIVLSNNYEMNIITTKTKVSEILEENHIVVLPTETVFPGEDSEILDNGTITISNIDENGSKITQIANEEDTLSSDQILANHTTIVEKKEIKEEIIPYETITKNSDNSSSSDRSNKVIQEGKDGLKRVTYSVKYQNDIEIDRTVLKEEIIKKPTNKIVQVTKKTTSRSSDERTEKIENTEKKESTKIASKDTNSSSLAKKVEGITPIKKTLNTSAYTANEGGSGKKFERTANGAIASVWYTVASGKGYPFGTIIYIPYFKNKPNGGWFVVQDRGGAITNNRLDVYMSNEKECIRFGRRNLECYIYLVK